jgi:hypothetical protein
MARLSKRLASYTHLSKSFRGDAVKQLALECSGHRGRLALSPASPGPSEPNHVATLELQRGPRLGGCGDLGREALEDAADAAHLLGVGLGELAAAEIDAVLEPDADVAA